MEWTVDPKALASAVMLMQGEGKEAKLTVFTCLSPGFYEHHYRLSPTKDRQCLTGT